MANKYLLIPEELYRGLTEATPESINLEHERKVLEKSKKLPKKDRTARNVNYQQELNRYLKIKREQINKPVKVEVTNGAKFIGKPSSTVSYTPTSVTPSYAPSQADGFQDDYDFRLFGDQQAEEDGGGVFSGALKLNENLGSGFGKKPISTTPRRPQRNQGVAGRPNPAIEKLIILIDANRDKYGIANDGRIKNAQGKPIANSNLLESLKNLLSPKQGEPTPKGTRVIKGVISQDVEAKRIFDEGMTYATRVKYNLTNISQNPPGHQRGHSSKHHSSQSRRPKIWG
jgi:hypothetical protein